ncbi:MAG: ABC transporter ATP-binding protein, partial [Verrucomicrobiae bacterium]|nr:ABC transporter ATP-binding protein [Verrucomicrobiae bacterium]
MTATIETEHLSKRYWRREAVTDLDLRIPEGQCVALLGPNGAGKSTTLKMLVNLIEPTGGRALVLGQDSRDLDVSQLRRIGYVSENQELPGWLTIRQFLDYLSPLYPTWDRDFCEQLLTDFDLDPKQKLKQLSRGQRMKAALVGSIAYRPKLLILDEPFSGLDPLVRDEFIDGVLAVSGEEGWTVLVASHDIEEVERLADSIAILNRGRLALSESIDDLRSRFRQVDLTLDPDSGTQAPPPPSWLQWRQENGR